MSTFANGEDPDDMQHTDAIIMVCTVCQGKNIFLQNTVNYYLSPPRYIQWTNPS